MSYTVIGAKELQAVFAGMPQLLEHKILQQGNADAAKLIVNAAKLMAPEGPTGNLVDSIGTIKPSFSASDAIGETHTGPRRGRFKGYAGHLVEFGTKKRNYRGANRGTMPKKPFMEPAFNKVKEQVIAQIETSIAKKLYAFMKRTLR